MLVTTLATQAEKLECFEADDPWNSGRWAAFTLCRHFAGGIMPVYAAADARSRLQRYSITSSIDSQPRDLPDALVEAWLEGDVKIEQLPVLLHRLQPQLSASDYVVHRGLNEFQRKVRFFAPLALGAVVMALGATMRNSSPDVAVAMVAIGLATACISLLVGRRLGARRRRQADWICEQVQALSASLHHR